MVKVRMLIHRTGSRYDGREWPPFHGVIDLPEWEAEELVRESLAEYPDAVSLDRGYAVLKEASPDYETKLRPVDYDEEEEDPRYVFHSHGHKDPHATGLVDDSDYDSDFDRDDSDNDVGHAPEPVAPQAKKPYANAKKSDWVAYAVSRGAKREDISDMTKAMLIDLYG